MLERIEKIYMDVRVEGWIKSEWRNSMEAASDLLRITPPLASQGSIFKIALFHNGLKADYTFWRLCSAVGISGQS